MSVKALPIMFINLGGEMMYVLYQRLKAQNIPSDKAVKVINDIVGTMLNLKFVEELFKPQELYSKKALRSVFEKLAHASIMRLNTASMDKLYDLMTMVFKYQVCLCSCPTDLLMITLNHLDGIRAFVSESSTAFSQIDNVYFLLLKTYKKMESGEFQFLRHTLLNFFQDLQIRVSAFLKDGTQTSSGRFVLPTSGPVSRGAEVPGTIREYGPNGNLLSEINFLYDCDYTPALAPGSLELGEYHGTSLGTSIYMNHGSEQTSMLPLTRSSSSAQSHEQKEPEPRNKDVEKELSLLACLIGQAKPKDALPAQQFTLNFFGSVEENTENFQAVEQDGQLVVNIDISKREKGDELNQILADLTMNNTNTDGNQPDDLLELMDNVS
ncbi:organic solute carrier partner 1 [Tachypleus tridentatus]|uniref:organic solute carrier partner 1 n=1 Tax=Tachypleus tridentatus TaxID=6853 RepID=UPI003FD10505